MKNIITRTIETTVKKISIIIAIFAGCITALIIKSVGIINTPTSFDAYTNELLVYQHLLVFFLLNGVILITVCCSNSSGLIANEVHEGTLRLLLAKPNSRKTVLSGKIIGNVIGIALLGLTSLLSYYLLLAIAANFDGNVYAKLLGYLPSYILYGLIVGLFFTSATTLLSCIVKRKIASLLPMLAIMIIMVAFFPIARIIGDLSGSKLPTLINYLDINYHFGQIFKLCIGDITGTQTMLTIISYLTNIFSTTSIDPDICRVAYGETIISINNLINPYVILIIYIVVSTICYYLSYVIVQKKDI